MAFILWLILLFVAPKIALIVAAVYMVFFVICVIYRAIATSS
jgi:hypothetical protein